VIVRFYEWAGKEGEVKLAVAPGVQTASETDLMERQTGNLSVMNNAVSVHTKPTRSRQ